MIGSSEQGTDELSRKIRQKDLYVDPPFLRLRNGLPVGHQGRHRALAAEKVGLKKIPVILIHEDSDKRSESVQGIGDIRRRERELKARIKRR